MAQRVETAGSSTLNKAVEKTHQAKEAAKQSVHEIQQWDRTRPDFPGEHLIVAAAGIALLVAAGRARTPLRSMLLTAAGSAVLGRAASGQGGVARIASWLVKK